MADIDPGLRRDDKDGVKRFLPLVHHIMPPIGSNVRAKFKLQSSSLLR